MQFTIKEYETYNSEEILTLYTSVGWTNYTDNPEMLKNAYANSLKILGAYDNDKLIGIIRVVGDGYSIIYIQDILIYPEYQHKGVGTALMKAVLEMYQQVYQKTLLTDNTEKTIQFYKSTGFMLDSEVGCAAFFRVY